MNRNPPQPRRALISVSDKTGLAGFARDLAAAGFDLVSTGGTARALRAAGLTVLEVSELTGFPEILDGRLKTLHPAVHGGLLARRGADEAALAAHGIGPIDLLVVNLYPFETAVADPDCSLERAVEHIDVGGPAMLRAAAKNHARVTAVCDPRDYPPVSAALRNGGVTAALRRELAAKAFTHTARYDALIGAWLRDAASDAPHAGPRERFPETLVLAWSKVRDLRYGENPHQKAAFYRPAGRDGAGIAAAQQLQGKPLSFNNLADADAAMQCVEALPACACVIVKHANPCGAATAASPKRAYELAYATDPTSAFGGIVAFNRPLNAATAQAVIDRQLVDVLVAPRIQPAARRALATKPNVRVLEAAPMPADGAAGCNAPGATGRNVSAAADRNISATDRNMVGAADRNISAIGRNVAGAVGWNLRSTAGGLLVQEEDCADPEDAALEVVTRRAPTHRELDDLKFAWSVCKYLKSNAIVYAREGRTLGLGAGQMSRVVSARVAAMKAADQELALAGAAMASDAFFPFRDGIDIAAEHGIGCVIQPGGSVRDKKVIRAADEHGLAMVFTGMRHFRH